MNIRRIMKLHDGMLKEICAKYQLTPIEAKIIRKRTLPQILWS